MECLPHRTVFTLRMRKEHNGRPKEGKFNDSVCVRDCQIIIVMGQ